MSFKRSRLAFLGLFILLSLFNCKDKSLNEKSEIEKPESTAMATEVPEITCDTFEIFTEIKGSILNITVKTELPEETQILVTINRPYLQKGDSKNYFVEYLKEKSTIGAYIPSRSISVDHKEWFDKFNAHITHLTLMNEGVYYETIGDNIHVSITVPMMQESSKFGKRNENLSGLAVTEDRYGDKYIQKEVMLFHPLDKKKLGIK